METAPTPPTPTTFPSPGFRRWCDPEWLPFVGFLLVPGLLFLLLGQPAKAHFFAGTALYLGTLKWLGWLVAGRVTERATAPLSFPAELLLGLAVLVGWFYLRNALALAWPASYGLRELAALPAVAVLAHLADGACRLRGAAPGGRRLGRQRVWTYGPFALALTLALWQVSGSYNVQSTDPLLHAYTARVYLEEGVAFRQPLNGSVITYPSGFGALNAVTAAAVPLDAVQAVNLQHVWVVLAGLFLAVSAVLLVAGKPQWPLHPLVFLFLGNFPLYGLYPDSYYESTGRLAAPGLFAALWLLPLVTQANRPGRFYTVCGLHAVLAAGTVALNPACAPFVATGWLGGLAVLAARGRTLLGQPLWRVSGGVLATAALAGALVLGVDPYYTPRITALFAPPPAAPAPEAEAVGGTPAPAKPPAFSTAQGLRRVRTTNLVTLSPNATKTALSGDLKLQETRLWPERQPQRFAVALALGLAAAALILAAAARRRDAAVPPGARALAAVTVAAVGVWLVVKPAILFLAGGLSPADLELDLLATYSLFLLLRAELVWVFVTLLTSGLLLVLLAVEARGLRRRAPLILAPLATLFVLSVAGALVSVNKIGCVVLPVNPRDRAEAADLVLAARVGARLDAEGGLVGVAAGLFRGGLEGQESHLYALGGGQTCFLRSRPGRVRFALPMAEPANYFEDYAAHVKDAFDPAWCLKNGVRYFYISEGLGLELNPGLARAVRSGALHEVDREGASALYRVVAP